MKKYLIGLLATAFLLSSCNGIKSPKFKKYSNQVEYSEYNEKLNAIDIFGDKGTSLVVTTYCGIQNRETKTLSGKRLNTTESTTNSEFSYRYDNEHKIATSKGKSETLGTVSGVNSSYQFADLTKSNEQLQLETVEDTQYVTKINKELKTYKYVKEATKDSTILDNMYDINSNYALAGLFVAVLSTAGYESMSDEEKAAFKFYVDNDLIFTQSMNLLETEETKTGAEEEEHVQYTVTEQTDLLSQFVLSKDKKTTEVFISYDVKKTSSYLENCEVSTKTGTEYHLKDEVVVEETKLSVTIKMQEKNVSLKKIDLSSYKEAA